MDVDAIPTSPRLEEWMFVGEDAEIVSSVSPSTVNANSIEDASTENNDDGEVPSSIPDGFQRIRVRVGESTREAHFRATQVVEEFLSTFFASELNSGKRIRLIYMGMLLLPDRTMGEYGIEEDGVMHAVITDGLPTPHPEASQELELKGLSNPANTLLLGTGAILYGLWTLFYHFPHLFSWKSLVLLALLSVVHISATVSRLST